MKYVIKCIIFSTIVLLQCLKLNAQCSWYNIYSNGFESNAVFPYVIPGTTYQNTPQSYAVHSGQKSLYLNFVNNCAIGTMAVDMPIAVCPNVQTKFSAWFTTSFSGIQCKIKIQIVDSNNNILQNVPNLTCPYAPQWVQFTSNAISSPTGIVKFRIYTNVAGGSGNDLSMDDLLVQNCHNILPTYPLVNVGNICSTADTVNLLNYFTNSPGVIGNWTGPSALANGAIGTFHPNINSSGVYNYSSHPLGANPVCPTSSNSVQINVINPIPVSVSDSLSMCEGDSVSLTANSSASTYSWSPTTGLSDTIGSTVIAKPTVTTTYIVKENDSGCFGSDTVTVYVRNKPSITVNSDTICPYSSVLLQANGASTYTWSPALALSSTLGSAVTAHPLVTSTYMVIGEDNACYDTAFATVTVSQLLNLTAPSISLCAGESQQITASGAANYLWSPSAGLNDTIGAVVTASPSITTNYTLVGNLGSCYDTTQVTVTVFPLPAIPVITNVSSLNFCQGDSVILISSPGNSYLWLNGLTSDSIIIHHTSTLTVQVSDANGCVSLPSAQTSIIEFMRPSPPALIPNGPTLLCGNDSLLLTLNSSVYSPVYTWVGTPFPVSNDSLWIFANASIYAFQTDTNGCVSLNSNIVNATFAPLPSAPTIVSSSGLSFCTGDSVQLTLVGNFINPVWSSGDITSSITVTSSGTYIVQSTDTCGVSHQTSVLVNVYPLPIAAFHVSDSAGCIPFTTSFINESLNANSYIWNFGDGNSATDVSPDHEYLAESSYSVGLTAISSQGCKSKIIKPSYIFAESSPILEIAYSPDSSIIDNSTEFINFNAIVSGADTFWWNCPDYGILQTADNISITMPDTGLHDVLLIGMSTLGCTDTTHKTIYVKGAFTVYIPNSFTPFNQDGLNDVFRPIANNLDTTSFKCSIYDRWGMKLKEFTDPILGWDGKVNGTIYAGIYNWIIECMDTKGVQYRLSGSVNILP